MTQAEREVLPGLWAPACMTADEWEGWRAANQRLYTRARWFTHPTERPCIDCPLTWAAEQRLAGRCNGEPGVGAE